MDRTHETHGVGQSGRSGGNPRVRSRVVGRPVRAGAVLLTVVVALGFFPVRADAGSSTYAPFTSWAALVNRQFVDLTTKAPSASQSSSWVSQLTSGAKTKGDLVDGLRRGSENLANVDPVVRVYRAFLGRAPDAGGLQFWIRRKRNVAPAKTWTVTQIATEFTNSNEFKTKYGSLTNRQFVTQIYTDVLGRAADPSGVNYWTGKLDRKEKTKAQVVVGFSESSEYKRKQLENTDVAVAYIYLMGRAPTTGEANDWTTRQKAGTTHATLAQELLESAGYSTRINPAPIAIDSGGTFTCAVVTGGTVRCWGGNNGAEIGDGTTTDRLRPVPVPGLTGITAIAAGQSHACALSSAGTVKCWGINSYGQLGDGTTTQRKTPTAVPGLTNVIAIGAGGYTTCALISGGTVKCWGFNNEGQVGNGTKVNKSTPTTVSGLTGATKIAVGTRHSCAAIAGGAVSCWGLNASGQLGTGTQTSSIVPVATTGMTGATALTAGGYHTCVLQSGGVAKCWGSNWDGQIGNGTTTTATSPTAVTSLTGATAISAGSDHTCAALPTGAKCWGENTSLQLGDGTSTNRKSPTNVLTLTSATGLSTASLHSCAISNGKVYCWGANDDGQVGDGTTTYRSSPVAIAM